MLSRSEFRSAACRPSRPLLTSGHLLRSPEAFPWLVSSSSTIFFVIQAQRDLAAAQSAEVSSLVALTKSKVDFEKALGRTLEVNRIDISNAQHDSFPRVPLIPGTIGSDVTGAPGKY